MLEVDLTDEDSIIKAAKQFGDEKLDILINCAGTNSQIPPKSDVHYMLMQLLGIYNTWDDKPFTEQTAEDLMWFFKVNVVVSYGYCFSDLPSRLFTELSRKRCHP